MSDEPIDSPYFVVKRGSRYYAANLVRVYDPPEAGAPDEVRQAFEILEQAFKEERRHLSAVALTHLEAVNGSTHQPPDPPPDPTPEPPPPPPPPPPPDPPDPL
jgi:hypothetical protein